MFTTFGDGPEPIMYGYGGLETLYRKKIVETSRQLNLEKLLEKTKKS